jgi:hypothetical protein
MLRSAPGGVGPTTTSSSGTDPPVDAFNNRGITRHDKGDVEGALQDCNEAIAPMFPLAPIPLPSKWHVRVLPAVPFQGLQPADAEDPKIVKQFAHHIQHLLQLNIDEMLARSKHIFWGKVFSGSTPNAAFSPNDG